MCTRARQTCASSLETRSVDSPNQNLYYQSGLCLEGSKSYWKNTPISLYSPILADVPAIGTARPQIHLGHSEIGSSDEFALVSIWNSFRDQRRRPMSGKSDIELQEGHLVCATCSYVAENRGGRLRPSHLLASPIEEFEVHELKRSQPVVFTNQFTRNTRLCGTSKNDPVAYPRTYHEWLLPLPFRTTLAIIYHFLLASGMVSRFLDPTGANMKPLCFPAPILMGRVGKETIRELN